MEMHVVIDGDKDLTGQLYRQLRQAITSGRLATGEKLPLTRLLAEQLKLSRKTVAEAYARLTYDKLLVGKVGSGSFVGPAAQVAKPSQLESTIAGAAVAARWRDMPTPLRHPSPAGSAAGPAPLPASGPARCWTRPAGLRPRRAGMRRRRWSAAAATAACTSC